MNWHIITGEFPPTLGGVSDYVGILASALAAAGDEVHVWCPSHPKPSELRGFHVHPVAGDWLAADLGRVDRELSFTAAPRRLLVQWVPHAYGRRSLNIGFCRWVQRRGRRGDAVDVMIHEPGLGFGEGGLRHNLAALIHRLMASVLLRESRRVWVAIPAWADYLRRVTGRRDLPYCWLPVPSNVPVRADRTAAVRVRRFFAVEEDAVLVGHFGTYNARLRQDLGTLLPRLVEQRRLHVLLLGRDGDAAADEFRRALGAGASQIHAPGVLDADALSAHLLACDLMLQPFSDGVSTRRTTVMAALAHGRPVVTTLGRLTEPFWRQAEGVATADANDLPGLASAVLELAHDPKRRQRMGTAAQALYDSQFSVERTVLALRGDSCTPC